MRVPDRPGQQVRQQTKCRHERGGENMKYISTRGTDYQYSSAQAIKHGIAPDGGLFVPESIPKLSKDDLQRMTTQTYIETAADVLSLYLDDYSHSELLDYFTWAYDPEKFGDDPAPLVQLNKYNDREYILELLSLIHISEPTRLGMISYAVFCLK